MSDAKEVVYICTNVDCRSRGSQAALERLRAAFLAAGLDVSIEPIVCFSACNVGPNVVVPSKRCWLSGVTEDKVDAVVSFVKSGTDVSALQARNDPVLEEMIFQMIDAGLLEKAE
jgi:NADH:ubiquinone oxidoreductase subunit E